MVARGTPLVRRLRTGLESRFAPWVVGALTAALYWWLWGSLDPLPWVYDEAAYLLQARIFATLRWSVQGPPLPEFFEQFHVFVTPALVPKYPPGHALLLVPGVWLGAPALVPLLAAGATAGLLYALGRRLGSPFVGLVAWAAWITAPEVLRFGPSYMAQTTSTACWVVAWSLLLRWREAARPGELAGFALAAAVGAITRPVSALALLLPAGVWILAHARRRGLFGQVAAAVVVAIPVLAIPPWWSHAVSGRVAPTPYREYSRVYAPWNLPGFRVDLSPPLRPPTPALEKFRRDFLPMHAAHRVERLPAILAERVEGLAVMFFGPRGRHWRWLLLGAFLVGAATATPPLRFGLLSAGALMAAYLWIAARPLWTVYYLEIYPVLALVTGWGVWRLAAPVGRRVVRGGRPVTVGLAAVAGLLGLAAVSVGAAGRLERARRWHADARAPQAALQRAIDSIPGRAIVFVSTGPADAPHESFTRNSPDPARERVWVVEDRGADNRRLLALAPDRAPYRYDPGSGALRPLVP